MALGRVVVTHTLHLVPLYKANKTALYTTTASLASDAVNYLHVHTCTCTQAAEITRMPQGCKLFGTLTLNTNTTNTITWSHCITEMVVLELPRIVSGSFKCSCLCRWFKS